MSDTPRALSAVSLRLAGEVGQATLDRVRAAEAGAQADLDQHVAAVRAALADSAGAHGRRAAAVAMRAAVDARVGAAGRNGLGELLSAISQNCPDVPFADRADETGPSLPLVLLLHYACGFMEEAVTGDWWPATDAQAEPDWESIRLAAVCLLISQAEDAADARPDTHSLALS